jgi:hypothetical protein
VICNNCGSLDEENEEFDPDRYLDLRAAVGTLGARTSDTRVQL